MAHKTIKYLRIQFKDEIAAHEIPAFRGAVADTAGHQHILFHNHNGNEGLRYSYPLIQYKRVGSKATLLCMDEGVEEVHHFFQSADRTVRLSGRELKLEIDSLILNQFTLQVWDKTFQYRIHNWIALNQDTYKTWQGLTSEEEKRQLLERTLIGNLLSFAKGIGWRVEKPIELHITGLEPPRAVRVKQAKVLGFTATFRCNVFIPEFMGLGKNVSLGFGTVRKDRTPQEREAQAAVESASE